MLARHFARYKSGSRRGGVGTVLISEHALLNVPTAICTFFPDKSMPRTPALAVASGPHIFIYRNLRPCALTRTVALAPSFPSGERAALCAGRYYKFSLPVLDLDPREVDVWQARPLPRESARRATCGAQRTTCGAASEQPRPPPLSALIWLQPH